MADQYTPEEIADIFEAYNNAIKTGTPISAELARQMQDAARGFKGATESLEKFGKSLGTSATDLGKSLYKGEKGVGQFADAIEMAANAIQIAILAIPGIGIAAKLATVAMVALAKGVNAAAKQGDALYKTYQDLGRAGATASDGITGVFRNMQNLGYGIEELDKMVALVTQNSETLAKFSLTAADGTNAFAEGMAQIQRDGGLRLLGKTTDDINSAGASFVRQQVMMGRRQGDIQGSLGDQTKAYILELDRLQRLTGSSADVLQKQQEDLMSEDAYNVYMEMLESQGEAGKAQIEKIRQVTQMLPKEYQTLVAQSIGGNVEAQQKLLFLAPNLIKDLQDPIKSTADTTKTLNQDLKNFKGVLGKNYLIDPTMREFSGRVVDLNQAIAQTTDIDQRTAAAEKNANVVDKGTRALSEAQIANMDTKDALQSMVQLGVAPATIALNALAGAASAVAGATAGAAGAPGRGAATGAAPAAPTPATPAAPTSPGGGKAGDISGLRIKSGEATAGGAPGENLANIARIIQDKLGGDLKHFSAFNDSYHRGSNSKHAQGKALDFTLTDPSKAAQVAALIRGISGISYVQDEYSNPSSRATAGHIHAEISAANGAILSGPTSGYRPNLTMHGTEAIVPLNSQTAQSAFGNSDSTDIMSRQLDKLDELVRVMQNQVNVSTKILQAAN
jgi:hypothetical protein